MFFNVVIILLNEIISFFFVGEGGERNTEKGRGRKKEGVER